MHRAGALLSLLLLGPAVALADDLPGPPESCPPGSVGHSEHAGQWCAATTCTTDADCTVSGLRRQGAGYYASEGRALSCREVALCVTEEEYSLGGNIAADPPPTATRRVAHGECFDGACPAGGECARVRRCAPAAAPAPDPDPDPDPASDPDPDPDPDPGGCAVASGSPLPWWAAFVAFTLLGGSRRR